MYTIKFNYNNYFQVASVSILVHVSVAKEQKAEEIIIVSVTTANTQEDARIIQRAYICYFG